MKQYVSTAALAVALLAAAAGIAAAPRFDREASAGMRAVGQIAVQDGGRVKPLSVYVEEAVAAASRHGGQGIRPPRGASAEETLWLYLKDSMERHPVYLGRTFVEAPMYPEADGWLTLAEIVQHPEPTPDEMRFAHAAAALLNSLDAPAASLNESARRLSSVLAARCAAAGVDTERVRAEVALNRMRPFAVSAFLYLVAGAVAWALVSRKAPRWLVAVPTSAAFVLNLAAVGFYGYVAGRVPVNNSYEGLLIFGAALGGLAVLALFYERSRAGAVMALVLAGAILLVSEYTPIERGITPPVPALQSLWLQVHVLTAFVAYAAFALAFAGSLVVAGTRDPDRMRRFDGMSYRAVLLGFVFLTLGILTGAAWARQAWGRYWGFDPKETWALVTWLVYAVYLHLAFLKGRREKARAAASIVGFIIVLFTFLGVNYLLAGLHAYS